jgi:hypothetical protein
LGEARAKGDSIHRLSVYSILAIHPIDTINPVFTIRSVTSIHPIFTIHPIAQEDGHIRANDACATELSDVVYNVCGFDWKLSARLAINPILAIYTSNTLFTVNSIYTLGTHISLVTLGTGFTWLSLFREKGAC